VHAHLFLSTTASEFCTGVFREKNFDDTLRPNRFTQYTSVFRTFRRTKLMLYHALRSSEFKASSNVTQKN